MCILFELLWVGGRGVWILAESCWVAARTAYINFANLGCLKVSEQNVVILFAPTIICFYSATSFEIAPKISEVPNHRRIVRSESQLYHAELLYVYMNTVETSFGISLQFLTSLLNCVETSIERIERSPFSCKFHQQSKKTLTWKALVAFIAFFIKVHWNFYWNLNELFAFIFKLLLNFHRMFSCAFLRRSTRTARSSPSRSSRWPPPTSSTWESRSCPTR